MMPVNLVGFKEIVTEVPKIFIHYGNSKTYMTVGVGVLENGERYQLYVGTGCFPDIFAREYDNFHGEANNGSKRFKEKSMPIEIQFTS